MTCDICGQPLLPGFEHQCDLLGELPTFEVESEAFEDLSSETVDAINAPVTPEQVRALVDVLTHAPQHAGEVLRAMQRQLWWPSHNKRDTQMRRIRVIRDAAVAAGFPVCSTNAGYFLGDRAEVCKSARRARRFADGAQLRARILERLAGKMIE